MAAAPSSAARAGENGAAAPSSSEAEKDSDVPTGAGSPTDVPNGQGALMNPGEFLQPLVSIASTTPTPQGPTLCYPDQSVLQSPACVRSEAKTRAPTPLTTRAGDTHR